MKKVSYVIFDGYFRSYFCLAKLFYVGLFCPGPLLHHEKGLQSPKGLILEIAGIADFRFSEYWICLSLFFNFPVYGTLQLYLFARADSLRPKKYVLYTD